MYTRGHPVLAGPVLVFQPLTLGEVTFLGGSSCHTSDSVVALFIILRCVPRRNQSAGLTCCYQTRKLHFFYQNYNFEKTKKNAENGFSRGVSRATERVFFSQTASVLPDPTRTHAVGFIRPLFCVEPQLRTRRWVNLVYCFVSRWYRGSPSPGYPRPAGLPVRQTQPELRSY